MRGRFSRKFFVKSHFKKRKKMAFKKRDKVLFVSIVLGFMLYFSF